MVFTHDFFSSVDILKRCFLIEEGRHLAQIKDHLQYYHRYEQLFEKKH